MPLPQRHSIIPAYMMAASIINPLVSTPSASSDGEVVSHAVQQLTQGYNATPTDDFLWSVWNTLLTKTVPSLVEPESEGGGVTEIEFDPFPSSPALDRLVLLVKELKKTDVKEISVWGEKTKLWTDLPLLGPQIRELWDRDPVAAVVGRKKTVLDEAATKKWLVSMQFVVSLVREEVVELDHLPIWSLRSALEEGQEVEGESARDVYVSVAAMWLKECGGKIWDKCSSVTATGGEGIGGPLKQMTKPGKLYHGPAWFSTERWEFWGKRLAELKAEGGLGEDAGERVKLALGVMEEVGGTKG